MFLDVMTAIPPIPHGTAMTPGDGVIFWVTIGIIVALVLGAALSLVVAAYRSAQKPSQTEEARQLDEVSPLPQSGEQTQVHAPEEEKILLRQ
jgi:hypothetical protein